MSDEPDDKDDKKEKLGEGTLISHLLELRDRLIRASISVFVALVPALYFNKEIFEFLAKPIQAKLDAMGSKMIITGVTQGFTVPLRLSFVVALFAAMPYILWQLWGFISPGLYKKEKRFAVPLLVSSIVLFYVGVFFAYQFVFPAAFGFFTGIPLKGVQITPEISAYVDFALTMFLAFGIAFEVPVVVVLLTLTGLVSVEKLAASRGYAVIVIFIAAAILTPPDVGSQLMMAIPMWLLFEAGLLFARLMNRKPKDDKPGDDDKPKDDSAK
jgi:sec-independent protein translocase protein TatC